ncbi:Npt1/Npt2 family nucleotide transporter [Thermodesulfobacteriota bacterium]
MMKLLTKLFKIYEDEISLFLWSALLLFLIRSSNILFNNYAETAFLKRFGVEYLPVIYVINAISTFFIMGFLTGIMAKIKGSRMLVYMLLFCGTTVGGLRFVVPMGFDIIYPVLYLLKSQYEVLLGLLYWNLANDMFNTRQSKRIFPLIMAGGVMGGVIGSFATPLLQKIVSMDNLMWIYVGTTFIGAVVVRRMGNLFPTLLLSDGKKKKVKKRTGMREEFKKILPLLKESALVKILVMLTLLPNIVIPIINYQFNYAVNETYASEGAMIQFFGYFRGSLNIVSFVILLFVGRLYGRWGLPIALMFHPINYIIAFLAFLFRFDIFSAMYARLSTAVLRNTINNPARGVLMGLFPEEYRAGIRPFLRGTVVRIGTLLGSGFIMLGEKMFHPRYLSIIAIVFVGGWVISTMVLKRKYSSILFDLISRNMLDLKSLEGTDVSHIFKDKKMQSQLLDALASSKGPTCLWYAKLIKSLGIGDLDKSILRIIQDQDEPTQIGLLDLLSEKADKDALEVLESLSDPKRPGLALAAVTAGSRLSSGITTDFLKEVYEKYDDPEIKARAVIGLYHNEKDRYKGVIDSWLSSAVVPEKRAGIIAAGGSGDKGYIEVFKDILGENGSETLIAETIHSLHLLEAPEINELLYPYLKSPSDHVRRVALQAIEVSDENAMRAVILLLGEELPEMQDLAKERLLDAPYQSPEILIESLALPKRRIREAIFTLLESLEIKDVDVYRFARSQFERAYNNLAEAEALSALPESEDRKLLSDHLLQKKRERLDTVLRVLATQDSSGRIRIIWRGLYAADSRQRSNALEALESSVGRPLSQIMSPLLEDYSVSQCLIEAKKFFELPRFDSNPGTLFNHLLSKYDWVTVVLTLNLMEKVGTDGVEREIIEGLLNAENSYVRQTAQGIAQVKEGDFSKKETDMEQEISIPDKILHLRGIQIFESLSVTELAAIASVSEEVICPEGEMVIKEGEQGDTMYMVLSGEVSVNKGTEEGHMIELDRIGNGDYFGEMALFKDQVRTATIRTEEEATLLVLHKREFTEIVREYPQIALSICQVLGQRILTLHDKIKSYDKDSEENSCAADL